MATEAKLDPDAFNAFEAEGWERRAPGYHDFFAPITTRASAPLLDAACVGPATTVLDVASGPGYVAAAAAERGASPTGVDVAAEMVGLARRLHPGLAFVQGDAERLPFADASFDAAIAAFAILHVGRPERAAAELARVARPGGRVAVSVWAEPARCRLIGVFIDALAEAGASPSSRVPAGPDFFRFADDRELRRLFAAAGLEDVGVDELTFSHRLAGPDELWNGMLDGTVRVRAMVEGQPEAVQRRIKVAFDRLASAYERDGALEIPVAIKIGSARRPAPRA